jgi:glycosyltransferase involved in cell wall biosynthesis
MRVLIAHDRYNETTNSGELNVVRREQALLEASAVRTRVLEWPQSPPAASMLRKAAVQLRSGYSFAARRRMQAAIAEFVPDVAHIHNFWPQATPAIHYACKSVGVAVVQTLHNYRILCAGDVLLREGRTCELCIETPFPWPAIRHRCVRGSTVRSLIQSTSFGAHRLVDTWTRAVDVFLAPTESMKQRFVRAGIDAQRIVIRRQSAPDPGVGPDARRYFLFAGRLSEEKGLSMLLDLWESGVRAELRIAGGGMLEGRVRECAARLPNVKYVGCLSPAETGEAMRHAIATLVPSLWEEPFPLVIAESYAAGAPVIAADTGSRTETVLHGETGLIFRAGDRHTLTDAVAWVIAHPQETRELGRAARRRYEALYDEKTSTAQLLEIYRRARAITERSPTEGSQ